MEEGRWEESEYRPPSFMRRNLVPLFSAPAWGEVSAASPAIPELEKVPPMGSREAVQTVQWTAPGRVLGSFPAEVRARRDAFVAVADGELTEELLLVEEALRSWFLHDTPLEFEKSPDELRPIEFFLDLPGFPGWAGIARGNGYLAMLFGEGHALRSVAY
jgi:hypothetical protein